MAAGGVELDLTGLVLLQTRVPNVDPTHNKMRITAILPEAVKAGLKDVHAPTLAIPLDAFAAELFQPVSGEMLAEPTILQFGAVAYAVWSLTGQTVWMKDFDDEQGTGTPSISYDDSPVSGDPNPDDQDEGWRSLRWFMDLTSYLKNPKVQPSLATCTIALTNGTASGRTPLLCAARRRKYRVDHGSTERSFGTHFKLAIDRSHLGNGYMSLMMRNAHNQQADTVCIPIRVGTSTPTPVSISHVALTATPPDESNPYGHMLAYYKVLSNDTGPIVRAYEHSADCRSPGVERRVDTAPAAPIPGKPQRSGPPVTQPHPPDVDCIMARTSA